MAQGPAIGGGGGQRPGDVRAGGAFVEISAKDKLTGVLIALRAKALTFVSALQQIGKVSLGAGLAGLTAASGFFKAGADRAEDISKLAEQLGFTVEQMQRLKFASDVAGVSIEDVLTKQEKFADLMASAPILSGQAIKEAVEVNRRFRASWIELQTAMTPLVATVVPLVRAFAQFVKQNADLVRVVAIGSAGLVALGVAAFGVSKALAVVGAVGGAAVVVIGALFTKVGLAIGVVGALTAVILTSTNSGRQLAGDLGTAFSNVGSTFGMMLKTIVDAIEKGDFDRAWQAFTIGVEAVWYEMLLNMARAFSGFIEKNRDRLIALGVLMGGIQGGMIGGRFGPIGAAIGGGIGAAGGGIAVDQLADLINGIALNTGLEERRAEAQRRLGELAKKNGGLPNIENEDLAKRIVATRGAFRTLFNANQQFGRSDSLETKQLEKLKEIKNGLDKLTQAMIDAANAQRLK